MLGKKKMKDSIASQMPFLHSPPD